MIPMIGVVSQKKVVATEPSPFLTEIGSITFDVLDTCTITPDAMWMIVRQAKNRVDFYKFDGTNYNYMHLVYVGNDYFNYTMHAVTNSLIIGNAITSTGINIFTRAGDTWTYTAKANSLGLMFNSTMWFNESNSLVYLSGHGTNSASLAEIFNYNINTNAVLVLIRHKAHSSGGYGMSSLGATTSTASDPTVINYVKWDIITGTYDTLQTFNIDFTPGWTLPDCDDITKIIIIGHKNVSTTESGVQILDTSDGALSDAIKLGITDFHRPHQIGRWVGILFDTFLWYNLDTNSIVEDTTIADGHYYTGNQFLDWTQDGRFMIYHNQITNKTAVYSTDGTIAPSTIATKIKSVWNCNKDLNLIYDLVVDYIQSQNKDYTNDIIDFLQEKKIGQSQEIIDRINDIIELLLESLD